MEITKVHFMPMRPVRPSDLVGFADVEFENQLIVKGFRLFKKPDGSFNIMNPFKSTENPLGGRENYPTITIEDELTKKVLDQVIFAYERRCQRDKE